MSPMPQGSRWNGAQDAPLFGSACRELGIQKSGTVRLEARIFLDAWPDPGLHNGRAVVAGFYAGPKLLVTAEGALQAGGQKGREGSWNWYAPESRSQAVPLGRWTEIAIEADPRAGTWKAWVDGRPVPLFSPTNPMGTLRPSFGDFAIGSDPVDGQLFPGKIAAVRVLGAVILPR